jgi:hypothetical protein
MIPGYLVGTCWESRKNNVRHFGNNLSDWGVFISEMPREFLEHLHRSTGNWPAQHFWMKQYITVV